MHFSMSCSCQFHFEMPQMCVAPSLGGMGPGNESLTMLPPLKKKSQVTTKCKGKGVHRERSQCQTEQKGPQPFVCEPFQNQSFSTVSLHDAPAGAYGSVSEGVPMGVLRVFVFRILFSGALHACLELFSLP